MQTFAAPNLARFEDDGYAIVHGVLQPAEIEAACSAVSELFSKQSARAGIRDPVAHSAILKSIADLPAVRDIAHTILGDNAMLVRSILFDKTPESNWDVVWHQDVTIAVREKHDVAGFGPWSTKAGVVSVQPPAAVLERMLTIRLHLDHCGAGNGPLLVVPGSHQGGFIPVQTLDTNECDRNAFACTAPAGAALLMRPLTLHASKKSAILSHRRVLHLDFACDPLPAPLQWHCQS